MGALLWRRRRGLIKVERVLLALTVSFGVWHGCNLIIALQGMLGLEGERWAALFRLADTLAVISITLSYSFLLHVHLHLWANAHDRGLKRGERLRVYLSYIPALFLVIAVPPLWTGEYAPMFVKLSHLVLPFVLWAAYVLCFIAATDLLIARRSSSRNERRALQTLAVSFVAIGVLLVAVYALNFGAGMGRGLYLKTAANLGSLLPSALIAYYIYRYRYLELIIKESLIAATFAAVVLIAYLYGIRTVGSWLTARYNLRTGVVESLLILALALLAAPLRQWIEKRFHNLFQREATLYREVVARIGAQAGQYKQLPELLRFVEERTAQALGLRRVRIILHRPESDQRSTTATSSSLQAGESRDETDEGLIGLMGQVLEQARAGGWMAIEGERRLREQGFEIAYALRREQRNVGLMLIDAAADALTPDARVVLEVLAGQVAIAVEDCRLVEENVCLERRLAHGERLAALGQMAATVAHEVRNPLSAIKSIAQVMREDQHLSSEYGRDLSLIVGETDRLSRSVTQLLSYARTTPPAIAPCRADELVRSMTELFSAEAASRAVQLECVPESAQELDGVTASATRDALSNLVLNALQATPTGGTIRIETRVEGDSLLFTVTDSGAGVDPKLRERIWEPFFTTRQRGTGLGLAIVRKRIEDIGGTTCLLDGNRGGACFELRLPLKSL
jgi:signal transduction histidine kinase